MNSKPVIAFVAATLVAGAHAQTIDNTPNWNGTDHLFPFGPSQTQTFGQTFAAPVTGSLTDLTFYLKNTGGNINYTFSVMAWDGAKATGPSLYQSSVQTSSATGAFEKLTFSPNASVVSGNTYVAFFTTLGVSQTAANGYGYMGATQSNSYSEGNWVWFNNSDPSLLTTNAWDGPFFDETYDMAFKANFQAVPEPSSVAMLGLAAVGVLRRRRAG